MMRDEERSDRKECSLFDAYTTPNAQELGKERNLVCGLDFDAQLACPRVYEPVNVVEEETMYPS